MASMIDPAQDPGPVRVEPDPAGGERARHPAQAVAEAAQVLPDAAASPTAPVQHDGSTGSLETGRHGVNRRHRLPGDIGYHGRHGEVAGRSVWEETRSCCTRSPSSRSTRLFSYPNAPMNASGRSRKRFPLMPHPSMAPGPRNGGRSKQILCVSSSDPTYYKLFRNRRDIDPDQFRSTGRHYGGLFSKPSWERFAREAPAALAILEIPDDEPYEPSEAVASHERGA